LNHNANNSDEEKDGSDKKKKGSSTKRGIAEISREEIQSKLKGRTLIVYFVLLNKGSIGVRELQRMLDLSSPSVSRYHLDKLVELNLVENRKGVYHLINKADLPVLSSWLLIGKFLLPRSLFGAIFFTLLFASYLVFFYSFWSKDSFFVILFGTLIVVYSWIEVILQMKNKPI
jgi:hypothetical protein